MVGDLKRGRTVRSLAYLLTNYNDVKIIFCAPDAFKIEDDLRTHLVNSPNISFVETTEFMDAIPQADAIYMQRIQDEYDNQNEATRNLDISKYSLLYEHLDLLKDSCKILHAMPRRQELDPKIDQDPRAEYWSQQRNGMWIRSSLIAMLMGIDKQLLTAG